MTSTEQISVRPTPTLTGARVLQSDAQYAVHRSHRTVAGWTHNERLKALNALDAVLADLHWAKWHLGALTGSHADFARRDEAAPLGEVTARFRRVIEAAERIASAEAAELPHLPWQAAQLPGTEIEAYDGVPLIPTICPIVVLRGSNRDMGRQYADQVIDIYGTWVFARLAERELTAVDRTELARWRSQLETHTPEVVDFALGWSEGARARGVELTDDHALAIWTGYAPPAHRHLHMGNGLFDEDDDEGVAAYLATRQGRDELRENADLCSGAAAWGSATRDGSLIAGSTTDHDCTFQATIVAYPDKGHRFIYTPFSVNGSIPVLGRFYMAGHPGMNDRGVAYVHHGGQAIDGGSAGGGPISEWGYGVRRGAATMHALQFADTAREARDMMLSFPVGDPGPILGTAGGLFADATYGVAIEERAGAPLDPRPLLRESTPDGENEVPVLYANNNPLHRDPGSWDALAEGSFRYDPVAGWHIVRPEDAGTDDPATQAARLSTKNSAGRNRYFHRELLRRNGIIDLTSMAEIFSTSGDVPEGDDEEIAERWRRGEEWACSTAHRGNAFTALMRPSAASDGIYRACIGPADRFLQVREPSHGYYYLGETNAYWEISLTDDLGDMIDRAIVKARKRLHAAHELIVEDCADRTMEHLQRSRELLFEAERLASVPLPEGKDASAASMSRVLRLAVRAQVRAAQAMNELSKGRVRAQNV